MARKKRVWYPGAMYHIINRGNRRVDIFRDDTDYLHFLEYIKLIQDKHPFKVHSLCLMTNHFHMALETKDYALWGIMQKILSLYAGYFNYRYKYTGHLFEGRYTSRIIEDEKYFLEVSRYIHLNPVKALMVKEPIEYEYSSYGLFVGENLQSDESEARHNDEKEDGNKSGIGIIGENGEEVINKSGIGIIGENGEEVVNKSGIGIIGENGQEVINRSDIEIIGENSKDDERDVGGEDEIKVISKKEQIKRMIAEIVDTKRVLGSFYNNSKEQYRTFVEGKVSHLEQEQMIQNDMKEDDLWIPK